MKRYYRIWHISLDVLWALTLVCLPLTSIPLLVDLTGAIVTPLSFLPASVLLVVGVLPRLIGKQKLPVESRGLIYFLLAVVVSSVAAFFLPVPSFKDRTVIGQELRAFLTLGIGVVFYLVFATLPNEESKLKKTLQWVNIGGIILIIWSMIQIYFLIVNNGDFPAWFQQLQDGIVVKPPHFASRGQRVTGLAYEASWFAHQMVVLYIPLWLAATIERKSAFKLRIWHFSIENILLPIGMLQFYLSSPRIALISFLLIALYLFIMLNVRLYRRIIQEVHKRSAGMGQKRARAFRFIVGTGVVLGLMLVYALFVVGAFLIGVQRDWRLMLIIQSPPKLVEIIGMLNFQESALLSLAARFAFLERMVYWLSGWHVFNDYPWLGVGLGNSGLFFLDKVPYVGWSSYEIREVLIHLDFLPNIKNLWVRLLAETGLMGFSVFITWLYFCWRSVRLTYRSVNPLYKMIALAGQLALIAYIGEGFSIDSFAMPYLWVWLGLISAAGMSYRQSVISNGDD